MNLLPEYLAQLQSCVPPLVSTGIGLSLRSIAAHSRTNNRWTPSSLMISLSVLTSRWMKLSSFFTPTESTSDKLLPDVDSLSTDTVYDRYFSDIEGYGDFHTAFTKLCSEFNTIMPGKSADSEKIKEKAVHGDLMEEQKKHV
ncbi:hypothetical protein ZIOFF_042875 [Zingiber officinale]|uniref:Uncharacterized protein n=1 Tax=Zingiber officinale TaxID=94328 RepID=A0A8J5KTP8_ZINOF|nr:hypothetical protein ZIOFF_042875 [Zingiber officinale]